jgi:DNA primase
MGLIPDEQLEKIRESVDIVQYISDFVPLKKAGRNFKGLCPFHGEKTPSFMVSSDKQIFHCFGCGEGGNIFRFLMKFEGIDFIEAVQKLCDSTGINLRFEKKQDKGSSYQEKKNLARLNRIVAEFYFNQLHQEAAGKPVLSYISERGIDLSIAQKYLLGYAPPQGRLLVRFLDSKKVPMGLAEKAGIVRRGSDGSYFDFFRDRLIFPIRNISGEFIGFGGRIMGDAGPKQPKYLNTPESPLYHKGREVYGLFEGRASIQTEQKAILVEGYTDVLALAQHGFAYTVAPLGTALTEDQVKRISRHAREIIVIFDGDRAGQLATWRALETMTPVPLTARTVPLPEDEDPDSFIRKFGAEAFHSQVQAAPGLMDYFIDKIIADCPSDNEGKIETIRKIKPQLARVQGEVEKNLYIQKLASRLGLHEQALYKEFFSQKQRRRNFPGELADDDDAGRHRNERLTPFERDLLKALLSNNRGAHELISELVPEDWQHTELRSLWPEISLSLKDDGRSMAEIFGSITHSGLSQELSGLLLSDDNEDDVEASELVLSCLERLKRQHVAARRQDLTRQIRTAESKADFRRIEELMAEQNRLL